MFRVRSLNALVTVVVVCVWAAPPATGQDEQVIAVTPGAPVDATVDPGSRTSVKDSWGRVQQFIDTPSGWSGDTSTCRAGDTTVEYKQAVLETVNWYRNLAGLADASLSPEYNRLAQEAALMMSAAGALNHYPGPEWPCWSQDGSDGAGSSNLSIGRAGPGAVHAYLDDPGSGNVRVGHRWWVLRPGTQAFGTGDTADTNALYVAADPFQVPEPALAWPSAGYFPGGALPSSRRWSFFPPRDPTPGGRGSWSVATASVSVSGPGDPDPVVVYQDETRIVWEMPRDAQRPRVDTAYAVEIRGVQHDQGESAAFRYTVTVIPGDPPDTGITSGPGDALASGRASFAFEPSDADAECRLDGGPWFPCGSPMGFAGLPAGDHVFEVRTSNEWGVDAAPASLNFTVPWRPGVPVAPEVPTGGPAEKPTVRVTSVAKASKLSLGVGPDRVRGAYRVIVQRRVGGMWKLARSVRTRGRQETRIVNLPRGTYRVVVPAQHGMREVRSRPVRLLR